jgi:hypothetical protein
MTNRRFTIILSLLCLGALALGFSIRESGIYEAPPAPTAKPSGLHEIRPPGAVAEAAEASPYEQWVMAETVCVKTNGKYGNYFATAVKYYAKATNLSIVGGDCAGFPKYRIIQVGTYVDHAVGSCGKTGSYNNDYSWVYLYGKWVWRANWMIVWINVAAEAGPACFSNTYGIAHVVSHELGHGLGLAHNADASVMGAWAYYWPTALDIKRVNDRYNPAGIA